MDVIIMANFAKPAGILYKKPVQINIWHNNPPRRWY